MVEVDCHNYYGVNKSSKTNLETLQHCMNGTLCYMNKLLERFIQLDNHKDIWYHNLEIIWGRYDYKFLGLKIVYIHVMA